MARSLKKGYFVHHKLQKKIDAMNQQSKKQVIKTWSRASVITPDFVGHKFGEFSPTRVYRGHAGHRKEQRSGKK